MNDQPFPLVVGLTGGIAAGKSTVSALLSQKGAHIIDADSVGHAVIEPEGEAYPAVIITFGTDMLDGDGKISRKKLGDLIFSDPDAREKLNQISHPCMANLMADEIHAIRARDRHLRPPLIVLDAAILFEAKWDHLCDAIWAVHVTPELAIERMINRNNMTREGAQARLDAQMTNSERARLVDEVITNDDTLKTLEIRVNDLWQKLNISTE